MCEAEVNPVKFRNFLEIKKGQVSRALTPTIFTNKNFQTSCTGIGYKVLEGLGLILFSMFDSNYPKWPIRDQTLKQTFNWKYKRKHANADCLEVHNLKFKSFKNFTTFQGIKSSTPAQQSLIRLFTNIRTETINRQPFQVISRPIKLTSSIIRNGK